MSKQPAEAVVEAYGAKVSLNTPDAAMLQQVIDGLPAGWAVSTGAIEHDGLAASFTVLQHPGGYLIGDGSGAQTLCPDPDLVVTMLRTMARRAVGFYRHGLMRIQAGVVAYEGSGILLPSQPLAGVSTLVDALVRAGAEYYADEFAMLDVEGRLASSREVEPGASLAPPRVPVALVALTVYRPGAAWAPTRLTPAESVVALMAYTAAARDRPPETLVTLRVALGNAQVLLGDRGDAEETAVALLETLSGNAVAQ